MAGKTVLIKQPFQLKGTVYQAGQTVTDCHDSALLGLAKHGKLAELVKPEAQSTGAHAANGGK